jgi:hypothetical protein
VEYKTYFTDWPPSAHRWLPAANFIETDVLAKYESMRMALSIFTKLNRYESSPVRDIPVSPVKIARDGIAQEVLEEGELQPELQDGNENPFKDPRFGMPLNPVDDR